MKRHDEFQIQPTARLAFFRAASLWPLLWLAVLLCPVCAQAQELPFRANIDCSDLEVEFVLSNRGNLGTSCSSTTACGGGNNFSTVFYNVRLKHTTSDPMAVLDFDLKYDIVSANDDQLVTGAAPLDFPINKNVTEQCSAKGPAGAFDFMGCAGKFLFGGCTACNRFEVTPYKNNDPLNGVSTYDLVLINKHILGLEALSSPYKIIAADANKSRTLSTFDIVELRKLILGIYTELPNNTSWRFLDEDYTFSNPDNPFQTIFPETKVVDVSISSIQTANFVAVKVGDVNNNALTNSLTPNPITTIQCSDISGAKPGQTVTIPVRYTGTEPLEAFQLGLRFDPAVLSLISPSQGELPGYNAGNFGLVKAGQGEIRTLWFADPAIPGLTIEPGAILFHLTFQVKNDFPESVSAIQLDDAVLTNAAWKSSGQEYALRSDAPTVSRFTRSDEHGMLQAICHPNPASDVVRFTIQSAENTRARLALYGPYGQLLHMRDITLKSGEQTVQMPDFAQLPAGLYIWKVLTPSAKAQGHIIKQ